MKPIAFEEATRVSGDGQTSIEAPVALRQINDVKNGRGTMATFCWGLTPGERLRLLITGRVWVTALTYTKRLQPLRLEIEKPKHLRHAPHA